MSLFKQLHPEREKEGKEVGIPIDSPPTSSFVGVAFSVPLLINIAAALLLGTVNKVAYKVMLVPMHNYTFFIGQISAILYTLFYLLLMALSPGSHFTGMGKAFASFRYHFFFMGCLDALSNTLGMIGARHLSGMIYTLIPKIIIPLSMLMSSALLKRRYSLGQVGGCILVLAGVFVVVLPVGLAGDQEPSAASSANDALSIVIYFLSIFPSALSFVLKESVLEQDPLLSPFVVGFFSSAFQVLWSIAVLPLSLLDVLGHNLSFSELPAYLLDGARCWVGGAPVADSPCFGNPWSVIVYHTANVFWNASLVLLLKYGGAVLLFIINTVSFPLSNIAFALKWPLLPRESFSLTNVLGLVLELAGLVMFQVSEYLKRREEEEGKENGEGDRVPLKIHEQRRLAREKEKGKGKGGGEEEEGEEGRRVSWENIRFSLREGSRPAKWMSHSTTPSVCTIDSTSSSLASSPVTASTSTPSFPLVTDDFFSSTLSSLPSHLERPSLFKASHYPYSYPFPPSRTSLLSSPPHSYSSAPFVSMPPLEMGGSREEGSRKEEIRSREVEGDKTNYGTLPLKPSLKRTREKKVPFLSRVFAWFSRVQDPSVFFSHPYSYPYTSSSSYSYSSVLDQPRYPPSSTPFASSSTVKKSNVSSVLSSTPSSSRQRAVTFSETVTYFSGQESDSSGEDQ